jgi:uncharacterized protein YjeT (DUF2065 family)
MLELEDAWVGSESQLRSTSAADLKFLHHLQHTLLGTSDQKAAPKSPIEKRHQLSPWFPKFVSDCVEVNHELGNGALATRRFAMQDFLVAIGLVLAVEGLIFAALPTAAKRLAAAALETPEGQLRIAGIISALLGVLVIWLVRG